MSWDEWDDLDDYEDPELYNDDDDDDYHESESDHGDVEYDDDDEYDDEYDGDDDADDDDEYDGDEDTYIPYDIPRVTGLRDLVPSVTYEKGLNYYRMGRVRSLSVSRGSYFKIDSEVQGTRLYSCTIWLDDSGSIRDHDCDCPAHSKYSGPCKHIIATLMELRHRSDPS